MFGCIFLKDWKVYAYLSEEGNKLLVLGSAKFFKLVVQLHFLWSRTRILNIFSIYFPPSCSILLYSKPLICCKLSPGIISYMKEQAKPPSQEVKSLKEIEKSLGKIDSTVVGFFTSEEDPLYQPFMESGEFNFWKALKFYAVI